MQLALDLAKQAASQGEVPVGAVVVKNGKVIGQGFNQPITNCDPTAHAEILALRNAAKALNNYRLLNTTLYVTLEPCTMCAGAMLYTRIQRLVFGASDFKTGAVGSVFDLYSHHWNHRIEYTSEVLAEPCRLLLQAFFKKRRN